MKALIDGDSLVYTIGFACQKDVHQVIEVVGDDPLTQEKEVIIHQEFPSKTAALAYIEQQPSDPVLTLGKRIVVSPPEHAFHTVKVVIQKIAQAAKANTYKVYLTGKNNFRETLATQMGYKHNRLDKPKPELYQHIRNYLVTVHKAQMINGMEADDALSIVYTQSLSGQLVNTSKDPNVPVWRYPEESMICAIDKDLRTVAGKQINFSKHIADADGKYKQIVITEHEARYNFWKQVLTGDTSDNVLGIPGVGDKKAVAILEGAQTEVEFFDRVYAAYCKHYGNEWFTYWHWQAYTDSTAAYKKRQLRPIEELEQHPEWKLQGHALTMLLENARLLWMLRKPINQDGSHWWMPPKSFEEILASPSKPASEPGPVPEDPPPAPAAPAPVALAPEPGPPPPPPAEYNEEGTKLSPIVQAQRDAERAHIESFDNIFDKDFL